MIPLLYLLFILSGAAGLFYESVWSRYLSLFVGHGAYAQVIVLVIFLGGMALGAALVSRITEHLADPLYGYAMIELGIGLIGLAFHDVIYLRVTSWAYDTLFPALGGGFGVLLSKWVLAGGLILPQSILLGATFPLMSAGVLRRAPGKPGTVLSWLYFTNSLGAAIGVLIAGFYLVNLAGLPGTLVAAAILNLVVGLVALFISKNSVPAGAEAAGVTSETRTSYPVDLDLLSRPVLTRLLLAVSAGTAVASFIYEVAWIRLLSLVLGSATHSFELMLSAFILGLALGAFYVRKRAESLTRPLLVLAGVQVLMGMFAAFSLALYEWSFTWMADLLAAVARTDQGYSLYNLLRYLICLAIMVPATFCAGMTLPLITRSLLVEGAGERAIGRVYGVNTFGSILGVSVASLLLIPWLGLKATLIVGATLDMTIGLAIGLVLLRHQAPVRPFVARGVLVVALVPILVTIGVRLDRALLVSGVYRTGRADPSEKDRVLFYRDGRTSTVSSGQTDGGQVNIATNGKPDGSLHPVWRTACQVGDSLRPMGGDEPTQVLLPLVTLAHRPEARSAAVIGHGTGMSSHALLASPILESVVTIEIEPMMVEASRVFLPANQRVFEDPRSHHVYDDAKSYFAAAGRRFDLIMAEPSNPWVSGVSGLFTEEFYGRVGRYLAPGGVLGQWLHTYELSDDLVLTVLAAIHRHFSDYVVYTVNLGDLLIVARTDGPLAKPDWSIFDLPRVRKDLCHFHPITRQDLQATRLSDRRALAPLLESLGQPNSDFYPVLDLGAERARFLRRSADGIESLGLGLYDFAGGPDSPAIVPDSQSVSSIRAIPRIRALMSSAELRAKGKTQWVKGPGEAEWSSNPRDDIDGRVLLWVSSLEGSSAPVSWAAWARIFANAFDLWHGGSRAWVDPDLEGAVAGYLGRNQAPAAVRAAVAFRVGLARRDWREAERAAEVLLPEVLAGRSWVDPDDLREGAVIAQLAQGRPDGARRIFEVLEERVTRGPGNVRTRLLRSYLSPDPEPELQKP